MEKGTEINRKSKIQNLKSKIGLWGEPDFAKFWLGQTISLMGSAVSMLALPLTAALWLEATPVQMGLLTALGALPSLLVGLVVGAWVDRQRRRPLLITADLGRAGLLATIPLAAVLGWLQMGQLYLVAFLTGLLGLLFDVAYGAYLPALVNREQLVEGNSKLELSRSAAEMVGPGLAGGLIQLVSAPFALLADAVSYLASALCLGLIRRPEPPPRPAEQNEPLIQEIRAGLRLVWGEPHLRALAGCIGTIGLFNSTLEAVNLLYLTRNLGLKPGLLGLAFAAGGIGFLVGALLPDWAVRRFGLGWTIIIGLLVAALSDLLIPLASGPPVWVVITVGLAQFGFGLGLTLFQVGQVSLRQALTPDPLRGRMNATLRVIGLAMVPVGGLLGGFLGELIGLQATLFIAVAGELGAALWLLLSPLPKLRQQPEEVDRLMTLS